MPFGRWLPCCVVALGVASHAQEPRVLDAKTHHLGDSRVETWPAGPVDPEGLELRLQFEARANAKEHCLLIKHYHVDNDWPIRLNGAVIGRLRKGPVFREHHYLVPAGTLRDGRNELLFRSNRKSDDILIGPIRLVAQTRREFFKLRPVTVEVRDPAGAPLPAKITVTDPTGRELVPVYYGEGRLRAVREGVVYTSEGTATFELPAGEYRIYASRGMEWGVDERRIQVTAAASPPHALEIAREVDTRGYIASDSHIHTLTFSGHGDASVEERMVTLAGEGVELAISTDHNHNTDYHPYQQKLGLNRHFTPVVGNEVTTSNGHFNGFPLRPGDPVPEYQGNDWVKIVDGIRARGAKVVILNHPRWPQVKTNSPFGKRHFDLNRISGQRARGPAFTFDAMELVNATVKKNEPIYRFIDWFALLNHGERIMAVGTSDSHTVGDPVGQGRTYLRSSTDDPAAIDVDEACTSFRQGHSSVSQGLFAEAFVYGRYGMGETAAVKSQVVSLSLRVAAAAWARPDRARVYLNGRLVADQAIRATPGRPTNQTLMFELPRPPNDAHLVCIATGPGVRGRFWKANVTADFLVAATNPIFLDADGEPGYTSPRHRALAMVRRSGLQPAALVAPLQRVDDAVAVQVLAVLHESYLRLAGDDAGRQREALTILQELVARLPGRPRLAEFLNSIGG